MGIRYLDEPGNIDLSNRPRVKMPNGKTATVYSVSFNQDGKEVLVPRVSPEGTILSNEEAWQNYLKTGKNLGKFNLVSEANAYAEKLHQDQAKMIEKPKIRYLDETPPAKLKPQDSEVSDALSSLFGFKAPLKAGLETAKGALGKMDEAARANKAGEIGYGKRLLRSGSGAVDLVVGSPLAAITKALTQGLDVATGGASGRAGEAITQKVAGSKAGKMLQSETGQDVMDALNVAGIIPVTKLVSGPLGKLASSIKSGTGQKLKSAATRIQNVDTKILAKEAREGATVENIGKYELFGKAAQNVEKARTQIDDAATKLKEQLAVAAEDPLNKVNLGGVFYKTREKAMERAKTPIERTEISKAIDDIESKFAESYGGDAADLDLLEAQYLKQYVGKKGDWLMNAGKMAGNPATDLEGRIHNSLYDVLKKELENRGGPGVREMNKRMSELIPLERANAKRVLVQSRKNPISLDDYIGGLAVAGSAASGNFIPAIIAALNVTSKSPRVAKMMYGAGKAIERPLAERAKGMGSKMASLTRKIGGLP